MRSGPEIAVEIVRPALVAASDARPSPLGRDARRVVNESRLGALDAGAIATEALLFQTGDLGAGRRITAARALAAGAGNESHLGFHDMFSSTCLPSPLGRKLVRSPPHTGFLTLPEAATRRDTQVSHAPSRCCHELPGPSPPSAPLGPFPCRPGNPRDSPAPIPKRCAACRADGARSEPSAPPEPRPRRFRSTISCSIPIVMSVPSSLVGHIALKTSASSNPRRRSVLASHSNSGRVSAA